MAAVKWIVIWAAAATLAAILSAVIAAAKNRNPSTWAAWGFLLPPLALVVLLLPRNRGPRPIQPSFDEQDRSIETP
ncbi:MAG TPA: hypothetical protein VG966_12805 [Hyphomicrobiaceae bacterium]|jgi:hypothetical protein|nr:hypothetical protein [Hyphomicrobiaceae bacterium]